MGLLRRLSKAQRRLIFGRFVLGWMPKLSYVMVMVSFVWLLALPHQNYSKETYVSENALMPGSATVRYEWNDYQAAEKYRDVVQRISNLPSFERAEALQNEFSQLGLKSATQNYTLHTSIDSRHGVNTYAVFYAPRSDGTEALVLSAPWTSRKQETNTNAIAMLLALGKVFKLSDGEAEGLQAWLRAYHGIQESAKDRFDETLRIRSGAIQAALNLDFPGMGDYNALGIFFEGVNGQLPNLDMINTVAAITRNGGIAPAELTLHDELEPTTDNMTKNYINSLKKMLHMMKYQAAGMPTGNHGLYLKYKIDAITLYGFDKPGWPSQRYSLFRLGALIESTVRSLNNLLEHLHQSFFFYLLSGVKRYTSIGLYMPPVIILGVSFIFQALSLWGLSSDLPLDLDAIVESRKAAAVALPYSRRRRNFRVPATVISMSFIAGWASFLLLTTSFGFPGETLLLKLVASVGVCIALVFPAVTSAHVRNRILKEKRAKTPSSASASAELIPAPDWILLKTFILALSALVVTTLSALNFSLAVSIGVIIVLPYMAFRPSSWMVFSGIQVAALIAISPAGLLLAASSWYGMYPSLALSWVLEGYEVIGSWLLPTICGVYLPLNLATIIMVLLPVS
ncbi:Glycosyl phosphatidyl inositol protein transamidase complex subunit [Modicella reniformis]|uniref:Glycosyl phosphatidyl inositol protein transamidase complex subunit n=1 Tax=Modicella reniformis TaxID=1440133 RepID=A0A9P6IP47_9FUNG|nr:Glycosyl phosphatidyl inositol protein transamidase complex subunit [Modicella reniformis]